MEGKTIAVGDKDFEDVVIKSEKPVLVDFWAPWCGPCLAIAPVLDALAEEYSEKIHVVKMNVEENAQVPASIGVRSLPFLAMFKDGKLVESLAGAYPKNKIAEMIDQVVAG